VLIRFISSRAACCPMRCVDRQAPLSHGEPVGRVSFADTPGPFIPTSPIRRCPGIKDMLNNDCADRQPSRRSGDGPGCRQPRTWSPETSPDMLIATESAPRASFFKRTIICVAQMARLPSVSRVLETMRASLPIPLSSRRKHWRGPVIGLHSSSAPDCCFNESVSIWRGSHLAGWGGEACAL
jgi:hypothetical protein